MWELGGVGGWGFARDATVTGPPGSAETGFDSGLAVGAIAVNNMHNYISGEIRYTYRLGDAHVTAGGTKATFDASAHLVHYDFIVNTSPRDSSLRPFLAFGGGIKYYRGLGVEQPYQPLEEFVLLTKTNQITAMLSVGAGVKFRISEHIMIRGEFRDFIGPTPDRILVPAPGNKVSSWMHDFVPMFGITGTF